MKNYNRLSERAYNKKSKFYEGSREGQYTKGFENLLCAHIILKENASVLDVACGTGRLLNTLAAEKSISCYGVDISKGMIDVARSKYHDIAFQVAGCENLPYASNRFDVLTVSAAYHHFPDVHAFGQEAQRVLKPKGVLYIAELYQSAPDRWLYNRIVPFTSEGDYKFYSPEKIIKDMERHGFCKVLKIVEGPIQLIGLEKQ